MALPGPPAYAWDWFSRQRLLWREVRLRLISSQTPVASRYTAVTSRPEVVPMLRADYPRDAIVRDTVHRVVAELVFLDRTDVAFERLGVAAPPRGMRWWWMALTGEDVAAPPARRGSETIADHPPPAQLSLEDVHEGYGDPS